MSGTGHGRRGLVLRLVLLALLVAIGLVLALRTVPRITRYRAVEAACEAADRGRWQEALDRSGDLVGTDPAGLRVAECRCTALLETGDRSACVALLEELLAAPETEDWLPPSDLTALVVATRDERGDLVSAAELAREGAMAYPGERLLWIQELALRTRTENERTVLEEMERRLRDGGAGTASRALLLAERYVSLHAWDEAERLLGETPDGVPPSLHDQWFDVKARTAAGRGDAEALAAVFDAWRDRGGDPVELRARHALLLSLNQMSGLDESGAGVSTLDRLRRVVAERDRIETPGLLRGVYLRLIATLVTFGRHEEALEHYDRALEEVGELESVTREDILRSATRTTLGEEKLASLQGTLRFRIDDARPGDVLFLSPDVDRPVDAPYERLPVPDSGVVRAERGIGTWPQRWALRNRQGRVVGSGAIWPRPEAPVEVAVERRPPSSPAPRAASPSGGSDRPPLDAPGRTGDGRRRVVQVILDCADWRIVQYGRARGEMPFFERAIDRGRRSVLDSQPPLTAVALAKLVFPDKDGVRSLFDLLHGLGAEIQGLNFVGRNPLRPLQWVLPEERQIFETFAHSGLRTVNLLRSHGALQVGRQAQVLGPGDRIRELSGYRSSRPLTAEERELLGEPARLDADLLTEMASDFDTLERLARESEIDFVALRVASLDLMTHSRFQTMNRTEQDDGRALLYRTYRYMDRRLAELAAALDGDDVLIVMSDHGIRTAMEHDPRSLFVALGRDVESGRIPGSPPIRHASGWIADLLDVDVDWPGTGETDWITRLTDPRRTERPPPPPPAPARPGS